MDVNYVCFIDESNGQITRVVYPQNEFPAEGVNSGTRVVYLTDGSLKNTDIASWVQTHWFNTTTLEFVDVGLPPNNYSTYNMGTSSWTWDAPSVLRDVRSHKNVLLYSSDWTQIPDNSLTDAQMATARTYRAALRDVTDNLDNPENVEAVSWPTPPSFI